MRKAVDGEGVRVGVDKVVFVTVEADLPGGGRTVLRPAQFYTVGGGDTGGEVGRDRAGRGCCEVPDVAPFAFAGAVADTLHPHFVFGFGLKTFEGDV